MNVSNYAIGIDLGGTKIEGILINNKNKIIKSVRIPTQVNKGKKQILKNIIQVINELKKGHKISGVGIAAPGFLKNGKLTSASNLRKLMGTNIYKELKKHVKSPLIIENDANCFALAEHQIGAGKKYKNMVGVIIGTGLGFGLIINNSLYRGAFGGAGELNHSFFPYIVKNKNNQTNNFSAICGRRNKLSKNICVFHHGKEIFEKYVSGPSISKRFQKLTKMKLSPKEILNSNEKKAKTLAKETHYYLALIFSYITNLLNPEAFILGGGVSNSINYPYLNKLLRKLSYKPLSNVKVLKHKLSDSSGSLGAASLVRKKI